MTALLLVTGSRALAERPEAEAWARRMLRGPIRGDANPRVLTGDARGPDAWAVEAARVQWTRFAKDGGIYCGVGLPFRAGWWTFPPNEKPPTPRTRDEWRERLLARDRALVAYAARMAAAGTTVRVLALVAPWSRTQGTAYTARLAREAGLDVVMLTYPEVT